MNKQQPEKGFTMIEVMMVVVILSMLAAVAIPRVSSSAEVARKNSDIATAHQVKAALDRYQVENGIYPKTGEITVSNGTVSASGLIPQYIGKLDKSTTQQRATDAQKGFGVTKLETNGAFPSTAPTNLIMIYLTDDGSAAEVRAYDAGLQNTLWSSAN